MDLTMRLYPYGDLYITETSLYVGKTEIPIDFDGKLVTYEENGKTYNVLEKIDPVDENDRNGRYKLLLKSVRQQMGIPDDFECELELINKDEGYICVVTKGKYEYNEDEKKMFIDGDDDPSIVEFNGDNMTLTDSDGEVEEYERIKKQKTSPKPGR